jgi:predicted hydrocarbon binding protein
MTVDSVTFGDYSRLNTALINHFQHPGKNMVKRIGRESAITAIAFQRTLYNMATMNAAKLLPSSVQIKIGLAAMMAGYKTLNKQKTGLEFEGEVEDRGDHYAFVVKTCPLCAGKQADGCIGWLFEATIEEAARQSFGKFFDTVEVECRAKGDPAGVWLVAKEPGDESENRSAP